MWLLKTVFYHHLFWFCTNGGTIGNGQMSRTHAGSADQGVLRTLPPCGSFIAEGRVGGRLASLIQKVVRSFVAHPVGMLAPCPHFWVFNWLGGQLGLENLWTGENQGCQTKQLKKGDLLQLSDIFKSFDTLKISGFFNIRNLVPFTISFV